MKAKTAGTILAVILLLGPLMLGAHEGGYDQGSGSSGTTTGCAGLDSVYSPTTPQETALGTWDDCSDGSRARFVGREDDLQMELDPSRRQLELGYRDREIVWHGRRYDQGHYRGEFKVVDNFGTMRWTPCDIDVRGDELTLCGRVTCRRTSANRY